MQLIVPRQLVALRGDPAIPQIHPDANAITGVILTGADVTELVHAEEKIQESSASERAAREANRLKTQFLTTITHEIRTPIAGILGICELLLGGAEQLTDDQRNLVEQAVRSADTLLELIGAVLDLRKVEENALSLETGPFSLAEAINDARLFSVIAQKKGLAFVEDVEPYYLGTLLGDRLRLRQVLANALSNAVKFTKTGTDRLFFRLTSGPGTHLILDLQARSRSHVTSSPRTTSKSRSASKCATRASASTRRCCRRCSSHSVKPIRARRASLAGRASDFQSRRRCVVW